MAYIDLDDGKIGFFVRTDHLGGIGHLFAVQRHLNLGGLVHNVIVREDVSLFVDNHARPQTPLGSGSLVRKIKEAIEEVLKGLLVLVILGAHLAVWRGTTPTL